MNGENPEDGAGLGEAGNGGTDIGVVGNGRRR